MFMNENAVDRIARVLLGIVLLSLVIVGPQSPLGYIGLVPLLTGIVGFCPIYKVLGIRTQSKSPV